MFGCAAVVRTAVVKFAVNRLPAFILPLDVLPVTVSADKVPTDVMFGCALVVTVAAVPAVPDETAYVAFATVPVTFAPGIDVSPVAAP